MRGRRLRAIVFLLLAGAVLLAASAGCGRKARPEPRRAEAARAGTAAAHS